MFTTLNVTYKERKSIKEKLHLVGTRKFYSQRFIFQNKHEFFTTRLITYSKVNDYKLLRFKENCSLPIVENGDTTVINFRYLLTLNTVINSLDGRSKNFAVVDPDGRLLFLLPTLVSRCHKVNVYTFATEKYTRENEKLFALIGSSALIAEEFLTLKNFDAVFSDTPLPFCDNPRLFGRFSTFARDIPPLSDEIKALNLADDEIYPTLAGLYYLCGVKNLGRLCCNSLQKPTIYPPV